MVSLLVCVFKSFISIISSSSISQNAVSNLELPLSIVCFRFLLDFSSDFHDTVLSYSLVLFVELVLVGM